METIIIEAKGEQLKVLKAFLQALNIPFQKKTIEEEPQMSREDFFKMIDKRKESARKGGAVRLTKEMQDKLFEA